MGLLIALMLSACEKPQTAGTARKADGKAWDSGTSAFDARGYTPGSKDAWEAQMRTRATGQNEYAKDR